jgi:hypothetical protein
MAFHDAAQAAAEGMVADGLLLLEDLGSMAGECSSSSNSSSINSAAAAAVAAAVLVPQQQQQQQ